MTRPSLRYWYGLCACFTIALVPVVMHSYRHVEIDDCNSVRRLFPEIAMGYVATNRRGAWMHDVFQSSDWVEGSFSRNGAQFDYSIIRSYDAKRLYHRPENYFAERALVKKREIDWAPTASGTLPIHRTYYGDSNTSTLVEYLLVYHSAPVANPYWAQLRVAPMELISGRHPMTLLLIRAQAPSASQQMMETIARQWLIAAWTSYASACPD